MLSVCATVTAARHESGLGYGGWRLRIQKRGTQTQGEELTNKLVCNRCEIM